MAPLKFRQPFFPFLVGSLTFRSPGLSEVSKTVRLPSLSLYLSFCFLAVPPRLPDLRWPCCVDEERKKASGKTRHKPCNASAVTRVWTSSSSSSHLDMATFPNSQKLWSVPLLLYCAVSRNGARFLSQQELQEFAVGLSTAYYRWTWWKSAPLSFFGHSEDYPQSQDAHKWSAIPALKMEDC